MEMSKEPQRHDEISVKELILNIRKWIMFIISKWMIILVFVVVGGIAGFLYAKSKETKYAAECTFVLDEGKSGGNALNNLSFLGMDVGNASAGLFTSAKNIIWLYTSRLMLHQTLLTPVEYNGRKRLLIDIFLDENGLRRKMQEVPSLKSLTFKEGTAMDSLTNEQSSIILSCIGMLKGKEYLKVSENSGADNIITVSFQSKDELFSKLFTETLVNKVNQYYIKTKTEKTNEEIRVLSRKADSTKAVLNAGMHQVASYIEDVPFPNPNRATLRVAPERKKVDVEATSAMYIELVKTLETRRMALAQETPLIQIIDGPVFPLDAIRPSAVRMGMVGAFLFGSIIIAVLIVVKWYKSILQS